MGEAQSSLVCVDSLSFRDVVGQCKAAQLEAATYACLAVDALNACHDHMELDDLEIPSFERTKMAMKVFKVEKQPPRFSSVAMRILPKGKSTTSMHLCQEQSWLNA